MNRACFSENTTELASSTKLNFHENNDMRVPSDLIKSNYLRMKLKSITIVLLTVFLSFSCGTKSSKQAQKGKDLKIVFVNQETEKKVDVMVDGKLFTSYCWYDNVYKPVLYPVCTSAGTIITRGFPLKPRAGERNDHLHQIGIWLNYGNVDGFDFWDNGASGTKDPEGGEVKHLEIEKLSGGTGEGVMVTRESWLDPSGKELLAENTEFHFILRIQPVSLTVLRL